MNGEIRVIPLGAIPELDEGDDLGALIVASAERAGGFESGDVVVVAQKAVSKVEAESSRLQTSSQATARTSLRGPMATLVRSRSSFVRAARSCARDLRS